MSAAERWDLLGLDVCPTQAVMLSLQPLLRVHPLCSHVSLAAGHGWAASTGCRQQSAELFDAVGFSSLKRVAGTWRLPAVPWLPAQGQL